MDENVLAPETRGALEQLAALTSRRHFYLAGGTGCALQLGHRTSRDLDFFSPEAFEPLDIQRELRRLGEASPDYTDAGTWVGNFGTTKMSFIAYAYPLLRPARPYQGIAVASLEDIGCMKVEAIAARGRKRDFIDLFFILSRAAMDLKTLLDLFRQKYGRDRINLFHILKSLTYFVDAEADPDPLMLTELSWPDLKAFLAEQVRNIVPL
ncbi:MAG: nucleotidyl transferase AbiEii/AbiGii toxin family protein [Candidatus Aminicenantes bacterium]|nr:nucleotidyl transferase AbiEii/AbiGii toxin family protein [Candidatus Aminicenantes bacterium]